MNRYFFFFFIQVLSTNIHKQILYSTIKNYFGYIYIYISVYIVWMILLMWKLNLLRMCWIKLQNYQNYNWVYSKLIWVNWILISYILNNLIIWKKYYVLIINLVIVNLVAVVYKKFVRHFLQWFHCKSCN